MPLQCISGQFVPKQSFSSQLFRIQEYLCVPLPFLFHFSVLLIATSIHFTHLFHSFVHPSRATPHAMGRPSAVRVTEHQPELRNSAARPTYLLSLSLPPAESCQVGTGFPYSFLPFTGTTDSIFLSGVRHSACGFEHSLSGYQSPGGTGDA